MEKRLVHDYPRLAKESGFNFAFRLKRVNWSKLDELDVEDIAFRGKYEQLEESIDLILNCDLDEEAVKVLDRNFVKLFRLAQISVGYLRHCLFYLDQCVVLLQEKLSAALQQTGGVNVLEKNGHDGFECEKCRKLFLTENYLTAHQKRRHGSPAKIVVKTASTQTDAIKRHTVSTEQQTDVKRTLNVGTETCGVKVFDKGVTTDHQHQQETSEEDFNKKLDNVFERLEAVEAKSQKPHPTENDNNAQILQYLQNIMPLLISAPKEDKSTPVDSTAPAAKLDETLLINLDEPVELLAEKIEKIVNPEESSWKPPVEMKRRIRRKKIASPVEISEEESYQQQPIPKPRTQVIINEDKLKTEPKLQDEVSRLIMVQNKSPLITPRVLVEKERLDVTERIERKMRELGIDPEWDRLPDDSFKNVMTMLQHRMKNPSLLRIRREFENKIDAIMAETKSDTSPVKPLPNESKLIMYDTDTDQESDIISSIVPVADTLNTANTHQIGEISPAIKIINVPEKLTTDLSIFQVFGPKTENKRKDSDSEDSEPVKMKSSLLIKNKDEPKKRVVFADKFILETTHDQLLDVDRASSSSSSNSWDISTP